MVLERGKDGRILNSQCRICESDSIVASHSDPLINRSSEEAQLALAKLIKLPSFLESRKARVVAMLALKRFAVHCSNPEFINLEISPLGQWCLQSLQSSVRELRIAAG